LGKTITLGVLVGFFFSVIFIFSSFAILFFGLIWINNPKKEKNEYTETE
jgi:hypothetical protein